jgi:hypothetical protein
MALRHARYSDARHSSFNEIGHDHITVNNHGLIVHLTISHLTSGSSVDNLLCGIRDGLIQPSSDSELNPSSNAIIVSPLCHYCTAGDETACLVVQIVELIMDPELLTHYRNLKVELELLQ